MGPRGRNFGELGLSLFGPVNSLNTVRFYPFFQSPPKKNN